MRGLLRSKQRRTGSRLNFDTRLSEPQLDFGVVPGPGRAETRLRAGLGPRGGVSIRTLAAPSGLSLARVNAARACSAPEDPGGDDDAELDGRGSICDRLLDEAGWLRQCANWLTHLHTGNSPVVDLRPEGDHPAGHTSWPTCPRVAAIVQRVAADVDELSRARCTNTASGAAG